MDLKNKENEKIKPEIGIKINGESYSYKLFESLESLSKTSSQRKNGKRVKYFTFCIE